MYSTISIFQCPMTDTIDGIAKVRSGNPVRRHPGAPALEDAGSADVMVSRGESMEQGI